MVAPRLLSFKWLAGILVLGLLTVPTMGQRTLADLDAELDAVIARYTEAAATQREAMRGAEMEASIAGRLPKFDEAGHMSVLRRISLEGDITFEPLDPFEGDMRIRNEVIRRYLEEEQDASGYGALNLSSAEYNFDIKAILRETVSGKPQTTYVFEIQPSLNGEGVVKGEIWVDGETGMPLKEAVELVRSPDWRISKISMTRIYELRDGISIIKQTRNKADVRLVGSAEIDIDYSNVILPANVGEQVGAAPNVTSSARVY